MRAGAYACRCVLRAACVCASPWPIVYYYEYEKLRSLMKMAPLGAAKINGGNRQSTGWSAGRLVGWSGSG